jgi:hypothetical protein
VSALLFTFIWLSLFLMNLQRPGYAAEYYVSPAGVSSNTGAINSPWNLAHALSGAGGRVAAGDTIWVRGGTYTGRFSSSLSGTAGAPIVVRQYGSERATLDGQNSAGVILRVEGRHVWFWGLEIMSSSGDRIDEDRTCEWDPSRDCGSWPEDRHLPMGGGIETGNASSAGTQPGLKFINLIVHDTRQGFSLWDDAYDTEVYGCVIYNHGWQVGQVGGDSHGHGIYTQNLNGFKRFEANILYGGYDHGIQAYGSEAAALQNFQFENNVFAAPGWYGDGRALLIGGGQEAVDPKVIGNAFFNPDGYDPSSSIRFGYGAPARNLEFRNNYVRTNILAGLTGNTIMTGNTFRGSLSGMSPPSGNTILTSDPTQNVIFRIPTKYDPARTHIAR